jgi:hypothetical protein
MITAKTQLIQELNDLVGVRMAVIVAPALRTLRLAGRGALADRLEGFILDLSGDLEWVLDAYDIRIREEYDARMRL